MNSMIVKEGYYIIQECPELIFAHSDPNERTFPHRISKNDKVHVNVTFDRRIPGGFVTHITTKEGYICTLKGNALENHSSGITFE